MLTHAKILWLKYMNVKPVSSSYTCLVFLCYPIQSHFPQHHQVQKLPLQVIQTIHWKCLQCIILKSVLTEMDEQIFSWDLISILHFYPRFPCPVIIYASNTIQRFILLFSVTFTFLIPLELFMLIFLVLPWWFIVTVSTALARRCSI